MTRPHDIFARCARCGASVACVCAEKTRLSGHKAAERTAPAVPESPQAHAKPTKPTRGAA